MSVNSDFSKVLRLFEDFKTLGGFEGYEDFGREAFEIDENVTSITFSPWSLRKSEDTVFKLYYKESLFANYFSNKTFTLNKSFDFDVYENPRCEIQNTLNIELKNCLTDIKKDIAFLFSNIFQAKEA